MTHELSRLSPARAGKLLAAVYGLMAALLSLLSIPIILVAPPTDPAGLRYPTAFLVEALLGYPILAGVFGGLSGAIGSVVYNLAARKLGGFRFDLEPVGAAGTGSPATLPGPVRASTQ